ncbi:MAG: EAL domain-containing protein [Halothiobacillaceae bacterium]
MTGSPSDRPSATPTDLQAAYLEVARDWSFWEQPIQQAMKRLLERVGCILGSDRVSLWQLHDDGQNLVCLALRDCRSGTFCTAAPIGRDDAPVYFAAIEQGRIVDAMATRQDDRTRDLGPYLSENRIDALMDATIRIRGRTVGVISFEYARPIASWTDGEHEFAISLADLVAQLMVNDDLRQREARHREVLGNLQAAAFRLRAREDDWTFEYLSEGFQHLAGLPATSLIGSPISRLLEMFEPEDRDQLVCELARVRRDPVHEPDLQLRLRPEGGQTRWVHLQARLVGSPNDRVLDGVMHDVSARIEADQATRRSRTLLAEAQSLARLGNWELNLETGLAQWSDEEYRLLGYTPGAVEASRENFIAAVAEKDRERVQAAMEQATRTPPEGHYQIIHRVRGDEDSPRFLEQAGQVEFDPEGRPVRMIGITQDVTEKHRAQIKIRESREALAQRNRHLNLLGDLATLLQQTQSIEEIVSRSLDAVMQLSDVHGALFLLHDSDSDELVCADHRGMPESLVEAFLRLPYRKSLGAAAMRERRVHGCAGLCADFGVACPVDSLALTVIPLFQDDTPIGCILVNAGTHPGSKLEYDVLDTLGRNVALAITNARHHARLSWQASHDSLTDLPNRGALHAEAERRNRSGMGLYLLDLDRFKEVNDTLGHHTGDELLKSVARRLARQVRRHDGFLARLGGDEFAVLQPNIGTPTRARAIGEALRNTLREPIEVEGLLLELDASIGIALPGGNQAPPDSHELLRMADIAMYEAKRNGSGVAIYDRAHDAHSPQRLALMGDLGQALREGQLLLHYQPKLSLPDGSRVGYEALVRWQHPERGLLFPDQFIPAAEVGTLIHPLTQTVFDLALDRLCDWSTQGRQDSIAINLSARNLVDRKFARQLLEQIRARGAAPERLEVELTETVLMQDPDTATQILRELADHGIRVAIDDFGTGYSSMAYLRNLPIDALKIDRTFVGDMLENEHDEVIVRTTIALGHNLGLKVIAEGVEDAATLDRLRDMGCDQAQGYHIGRPAPLA